MTGVISLIPARSGSKGIPDKNMQLIGGKTLIQRAIDYSASASWIERCFISTDSPDYRAHAMGLGAGSLGLRSNALSGDAARSIDVVKDFVSAYEEEFGDVPTFIVLLQPTSPIRPLLSDQQVQDLFNEADGGFSSAVTVAEINEPHPYKMLIDEQNQIVPLFGDQFLGTPRQELPRCFCLTGSIYIYRVSELKAATSSLFGNVKYIPQESFINIDTFDDLERARQLL